MKRWLHGLAQLLALVCAGGLLARNTQAQGLSPKGASPSHGAFHQALLDTQLLAVLQAAGFTGTIETQLTTRLGRPLNPYLADVGRYLFFDPILGLNNDNACAGCHSPLRGFGDTQPIAIGVQNNGIVGPGRAGPRNERRAPQVLNTAFYPNLMWDSPFAAVPRNGLTPGNPRLNNPALGNPFNNLNNAFAFPAPDTLLLANLPTLQARSLFPIRPTLLMAQAFIPVTELDEMAGFGVFADDAHDAMRAAVVQRLNANQNYLGLFGRVFPNVGPNNPTITYDMVGAAIAEFEFTLVRATAPLDLFARGHRHAMTYGQKRGALLFFGKAGCVACHAVAGPSNEMFSDFQSHDLLIPQLIGKVTNGDLFVPGNQGEKEDFGRGRVTGLLTDRYKFRTAPLRNLALQPYFFHDGAYSSLEGAILQHLDVLLASRLYSPAGQGLALDLRGPTGPFTLLQKQIQLRNRDPRVARPTPLTPTEIRWLVEFVGYGLLDPRASPNHLRQLIPRVLPSGRTPLLFQ